MSSFAVTFPHSTEIARARVATIRGRKNLPLVQPEEFEIEDYLVSLTSRIKPLKIYGDDTYTACMRCFRALWPSEEAPSTMSALVERVMRAEERLCEWRESAARVGADEALSFVLSWYEDIELDVLQTMRAGSPYTTDPELIKKRQERAYSFVQYGEIHQFVEGPPAEAEGGEDSRDSWSDYLDDEEVTGQGDGADIPPAGTSGPSSSGVDPAT